MCSTDVKSGTEMYAKLYPETSSDGVSPAAHLPRPDFPAALVLLTLPAWRRFCDWGMLFQTLPLTPHKGQWNGTNGLMDTGQSCSRTQLTLLYALDP